LTVASSAPADEPAPCSLTPDAACTTLEGDATAERPAIAHEEMPASNGWTLAQPRPPGETNLQFTARSIWKLYQGWIITLLLLVALQFALIVALLIQSLKRRGDRMALTETTQRFRLAGLAGRVGMWQWDLDADKMTIEPQLRDLLGYDETFSDARTADWRTHIHREDLPKVMQAASDHFRGHTPYFEIQHRIVDKNGHVRWFLSRGQAQKPRAGEPKRIIGASIDITERKRSENARVAAQEALQEKQAELAHLSRAATVGSLSVALAHEINQPLTAILTNAQTARQFLRTATGDHRELSEIVLDIENDGRRAAEVIQKLRNLLRRSDGDFERIHVESIVDEVLHLLRSELLERRIIVLRTTGSQPEPILGDSVQLQQVLLNLLNNATDAMRDVEPAARKLSIAVERTKTGWSRISVSDCGSGLSEHDRERLFEPFFTTKRSGLGLGLSISRSIVEAHAGRIWAENNRTGGATFYIDIPAASAAVAAPATKAG
jgi:PAS domain S-box-containing protein